MKDIRIQFGQRLRLLRNNRGMSQQVLSDRMGVSRTYISKIENGKQNPTLQKIHTISLSLDISLSNLFDFSADPVDGQET